MLDTYIEELLQTEVTNYTITNEWDDVVEGKE